MKKVSLVQMKEHQKGKVAEILGGGSLQHRMMSLGVYPGSNITKLSHFALRGPVTVKVGRTVLALGDGMASKVMVLLE
ncbi:MAG: FeoA family protein [Candidatus Omnitrophota bacterium]